MNGNGATGRAGPSWPGAAPGPASRGGRRAM